MTNDDLAFLFLLDLSEHFVNSIRVFDVAQFNPCLKDLRQKRVLADIADIKLHVLFKEFLERRCDDLEKFLPPDFAILLGGRVLLMGLKCHDILRREESL